MSNRCNLHGLKRVILSIGNCSLRRLKTLYVQMAYLPELGDLGLADSISAFLHFPTVQVLSTLLDSSPANQIAVTATDTQEGTCSIRYNLIG
jgi:hypothetical protein